MIIRRNSTEHLYHIGLILFILVFLNTETEWGYFLLSAYVLKPFFLMVMILHVSKTFLRYKKLGEFIVFYLLLLLSIIVGYNAGVSHERNMLFELTGVFFLLIGAKDINFNNILKTYLIVGALYCMMTILASLLGIIENKSIDSNAGADYTGVERTLRMSLGYGHPTDLANHVFLILLTYFCYIGRPLKKLELIIYLVIGYILLEYTGTRLSFVCIFSLVVVAFLFRKRLCTGIKNRLLIVLMSICVPIFCLISYVVTIKYDNSNMVWLIVDEVLSGRLHYGSEAIEKYGIPLLGQVYEEYTFADDSALYNFIDSSYIRALVIYGVIYTAAILIAYVILCLKALKNSDLILYISIFFAGICGLISQHFIQLYMNPFIIALFATLKPCIDGRSSLVGSICKCKKELSQF